MPQTHFLRRNSTGSIPYRPFVPDGSEFATGISIAAGDVEASIEGGTRANAGNLPTVTDDRIVISPSTAERDAAYTIYYIEDQTATKAFMDDTVILWNTHRNDADSPFSFGVMARGSCEVDQSPSISQVQLDDGETAGTNSFIGARIKMLSGAGATQASRIITAYDGVARVANISPDWTTAPSAGDLYEIYEDVLSVISIPSAAEIVTENWDRLRSAHTTPNTMGETQTAALDRLGIPASDLATILAAQDVILSNFDFKGSRLRVVVEEIVDIVLRRAGVGNQQVGE